mmetsp:Transcript_44680/g.118559  ORF Transcript_44680/g.118559 Transcript_44680/m.118559 type:complete len:80 (-) Transcript_44680:697-936(-)
MLKGIALRSRQERRLSLSLRQETPALALGESGTTRIYFVAWDLLTGKRVTLGGNDKRFLASLVSKVCMTLIVAERSRPD